LPIIQRVAEQMAHGGGRIYATLRQIGKWIGIGSVHQPAMRPQRRQLIQLAIEGDVRGAGISRAGQGHEESFWRGSMVVRCRTDDSAGSATATPIAPGRATTSAWFRPDVIAVRTGLAMRARAGVLTRAPVNQPHAMEHSDCGVISIHRNVALCAVATAGHSNA
jgi:hypothetical protein